MSEPVTTGIETASPGTSTGRFCAGCSYNLHGLTSHRCPECGRPFNPEDLASFTIRPLSPTARLVLRTRNWSIALLLATAFVCWLAGHCMSGPWSMGSVACAWIWLSLLVLILGQWVTFRLFADRYFFVGSPNFNHRPWMIAAGSLAVMLVLNCTHLPGRLIFSLSRPMLDQTAKSVYASQGSISPGWIGLYSIDSVHFEEAILKRAHKRGGGTFKVRAVCFEPDTNSDDLWLVYCPDGNLADLPRDFRDQFHALGGGWYEWHDGPVSCPLVEWCGYSPPATQAVSKT